MAKRRMFSSDIVDSDKFLDMPVSGRCLYYDLGMRADDDGFVSPKKILRLTGATEDDLRILIAKNFIIPFQSGVIVIRDWRLNNYLRKDRYTETIYKKEKSQLSLDENESYLLETNGIPNGNQWYTQVRLGKDRLGKVSSKNRQGAESSEEDGDKPQAEGQPSKKKGEIQAEYGNTQINECTKYLQEKMGASLDGSQKENRQYCYNLLRKMKKDYPDADPVDSVKLLIDAAHQDRFHSKNATGFKYLYYNIQRIAQSFKSDYGLGEKSDIQEII